MNNITARYTEPRLIRVTRVNSAPPLKKLVRRRAPAELAFILSAADARASGLLPPRAGAASHTEAQGTNNRRCTLHFTNTFIEITSLMSTQ